MNTPKLISLLSGSTGATEPSRFGKAADPVHGLDFSRLLGEKRSQPAPAPARPSQSDVGQSRSNKPQGSNSSPAASRQESGNRNAAAGGPAASAPANTPAASDSSRNDASQPATRDNQPVESPQANSPAQGATGTAAAENPAADTHTPAGTTEASELADASAETGLPALAVAPATPLATVLTTEAVQLAGASGPLATPQGQVLGAATPATAQAAVMAGAQPEAGSLALGAQQTGEARLTSTVQTTAANTAATPVQAALTQVANAAQTHTAGIHAANTAAPQPGADALAATALPQAQAIDASNSAAALSLQEFTAMVAAARVTSGTELAPLHQQATPFSGVPIGTPALAGLMPGSMIPGQAPIGIAAGGSIAAPLNSPQWPTEFGRQFISIARGANGLGQVAELRLDPPELGPLRITINLNDNVAHAVISSPHAMVRQTVENALPQLQQMLEQAGISLGQANVNDQHQPGQGSQESGAGGTMHARADAAGTAADSQAGTETDRQGRRADPSALVDTFA